MGPEPPCAEQGKRKSLPLLPPPPPPEVKSSTLYITALVQAVELAHSVLGLNDFRCLDGQIQVQT